MGITKREARELVDEVVGDARGRLHDRHAVFFFRRFLPALRVLEHGRVSRPDRARLGDGWSDVGDTHDFCSAPRAAMRAYRRALGWSPDHAWAHGELANVLIQLDRPHAARRQARLALELQEDTVWRMHLESARDVLRDGRNPWRLEPGPGPTGAVAEKLAQGQPRAALARLARPASAWEHQLRARAFGVLGDLDRQLAEWAAVAADRGPVEIGIADWFFAHEDLADQPAWWKTQMAMRTRITGWFGPWIDSLWDVVPEPARAEYASAAALRRRRKRLRLLFEYHLARTQRNLAAARRLKQRRPDWPEAAALVRKIM